MGLLRFTSESGSLTKPTGGILFAQGSLWHEQRRWALRVFRDFGLGLCANDDKMQTAAFVFEGKNAMQERILDEVRTLLDRTYADVSAAPDGEHEHFRHTDIAVGSIINALVLGYRYTEAGSEREAEFYRYKDLTTKILHIGKQAAM